MVSVERIGGLIHNLVLEAIVHQLLTVPLTAGTTMGRLIARVMATWASVRSRVMKYRIRNFATIGFQAAPVLLG